MANDVAKLPTASYSPTHLALGGKNKVLNTIG